MKVIDRTLKKRSLKERILKSRTTEYGVIDNRSFVHGMQSKEYRRHKLLVYITLIPVIATAIMIFLFSSQSGSESASTSGGIVSAVLEVVEPEFDQLSETEQTTLMESLQHIIRKLAHFLEYAMLGFFLMLHIKVRGNIRRGWLWAFGMGTAYAITDEIHQMLVGTRSGQISDVLLDGAGVLCGVGVLLVMWYVVDSLHGRRQMKEIE